MKTIQAAIPYLGVVLVCLAHPAPGAAQDPPADAAPMPQIGRIIIVGNTVTRDHVIRNALGLYPGQALRFAELRDAERRLARLGLFERDPGKGSRPTVTAIPTEDLAVQDVLVRVKETTTGTLKCSVGIHSSGRLMLQLRLDERNFDPRRLPTCIEDLTEARAFRGGGRRLRITLTLGPRQ